MEIKSFITLLSTLMAGVFTVIVATLSRQTKITEMDNEDYKNMKSTYRELIFMWRFADLIENGRDHERNNESYKVLGCSGYFDYKNKIIRLATELEDEVCIKEGVDRVYSVEKEYERFMVYSGQKDERSIFRAPKALKKIFVKRDSALVLIFYFKKACNESIKDCEWVDSYGKAMSAASYYFMFKEKELKSTKKVWVGVIAIFSMFFAMSFGALSFFVSNGEG
ncbi:hypothetical protein [Chromohalobacter japonicus]|uniref:hypothetical protein n=1 Tax=Chromohalobacter japonicus TaxID=223900 RepID=UPI001FF6508E|nr:hypothetical protein [Chromohalobacter japonicus]MCK0753467.1 hypothetical protein [Chromohalobacter japonicus]